MNNEEGAQSIDLDLHFDDADSSIAVQPGALLWSGRMNKTI
jgi:hypothetical protein